MKRLPLLYAQPSSAELAGAPTQSRALPVSQVFWWPVAVGVALLVLQSAVDKPAFWIGLAVGGVVANIAVLIGLVRAVRAASARADRLETEMDAERARIEVLFQAALPEWLRVAIRHAQRSGRIVQATTSGLRFSEADGTEIWTVPLPVPVDAMTPALQHRELHRRLSIDQLAYTLALVAVD